MKAWTYHIYMGIYNCDIREFNEQTYGDIVGLSSLNMLVKNNWQSKGSRTRILVTAYLQKCGYERKIRGHKFHN